MSDKTQKFLAKLPLGELAKILEAIAAIRGGNTGNLKIKPIKGHKGYFRVRVGRIRIIFRRVGGGYEVIQISYRDEQTYRDF